MDLDCWVKLHKLLDRTDSPAHIHYISHDATVPTHLPPTNRRYGQFKDTNSPNHVKVQLFKETSNNGFKIELFNHSACGIIPLLLAGLRDSIPSLLCVHGVHAFIKACSHLLILQGLALIWVFLLPPNWWNLLRWTQSLPPKYISGYRPTKCTLTFCLMFLEMFPNLSALTARINILNTDCWIVFNIYGG